MIELLVGTDKVFINGKGEVICNNLELKKDIERAFIPDINDIPDQIILTRLVMNKFGGTIVGDDPAYNWMKETTGSKPSKVDLVY